MSSLGPTDHSYAYRVSRTVQLDTSDDRTFVTTTEYLGLHGRWHQGSTKARKYPTKGAGTKVRLKRASTLPRVPQRYRYSI